MDLLDQIERTIRVRGLIDDDQPVLVAVSGGVDSMVLLRALHELAGRHGWRLTIGHFNHKLRGRSSDADERLVRRVGARLGLPVRVGSAAAGALERRSGLSLEMAARTLRHDFLARLASRHRIRTVALAHHADDQVELFFMRLLRGSGGDGLGGMKWKGPSPSSARVDLVRPLLDLPKAALLEYATRQQVVFREDATNASLDLQRNRVRHELIPLLETKYQAALRRTIPRVMDIVREEADLALQVAKRWNLRPQTGKEPGAEAKALWPENTDFGDLPVAVQRRCLQLQLLDLHMVADFETVERLRLRSDPSAAAAQGAIGKKDGCPPALVVRGEDGLIRLESAAPTRFATECRSLSLYPKGGEADFAGMTISWKITRAVPRVVFGGQGREVFDADSVGRHVVLRRWRPGDRFHPIGRDRDAKLQDIFVNQKTPRACRHELLVAASASGCLFWVEGLRISERFKVTDQTKRCLHWHWKRV